MHPAKESPTISTGPKAPASPTTPGPSSSPPGPLARSHPPCRSCAPPSVRRRLHTPHLPTLRRPAPGRHPHHRMPHRSQPAAHRRGPGPRPPLQLPPRLLPPPLLAVAPRTSPGRLPPATLDSDRRCHRGRRRHRGRTPRPEGLRQGSGTATPCVRPIPAPPSARDTGGSSGHPGPLPLRRGALGLARPGRPVSFRTGQPAARPAAKRPRICCGSCWPCCVAGFPSAASSAPPTATSPPTTWPASPLAIGGGSPWSAASTPTPPCTRRRPPRRPSGRPVGRGSKGPGGKSPQEVVAQSSRPRRLNVSWYGGGRRDIAVVTGTGQWYRSGEGLVGVR